MAPDPLRGILHIGAAAEAVGCCTKTLVNYVKRGVIADRRDSANRRVFTRFDIQKVKRHLK